MPIDKISRLNQRLKELKMAFDWWKMHGIDEDLLIIYLADRTKLSKGKVKLMLKSIREFFDKLVGDTVVEEL